VLLGIETDALSEEEGRLRETVSELVSVGSVSVMLWLGKVTDVVLVADPEGKLMESVIDAEGRVNDCVEVGVVVGSVVVIVCVGRVMVCRRVSVSDGNVTVWVCVGRVTVAVTDVLAVLKVKV